MKRLFYYISVVYFLFVSAQVPFAYLGKSIRIMGFGEELTGIVQDEYTDIYRNPAYLSFVDRAKVFGQYNLYEHPELEVAQNFRNKETGLAGVVLPLSGYGNLALLSELKPSTNNDASTKTSRVEQVNYYTIDSSSVKWFRKETVQNFKMIYALKLSSSLRLGADFVYLKNYHDADHRNKTIKAQRDINSDNLSAYTIDDRFNDSNNSPDAQRGTLGMILTPFPKYSVDFALYYENLSYTSKTSSKRETETTWFRSDTSFRDNFSWHTGGAPIKNRAVGVDVNFKYHFPQNTTLSILLGGRYQKNELSSFSQDNDSGYTTPYFVSSGNKNSFLQHDDRVYSFVMGIGTEKDFSPSVKIGVALKGYGDRVKLDREEWQKSSGTSMRGDSVTNSSFYFTEKQVKKTTNSYRVILPIGAEVVLHKMIKARLGGGFIIDRTETETGSSTRSQDYYYQGFGFSYNEWIFLDVYVRDELTRIGNWMAKVEYRF